MDATLENTDLYPALKPYQTGMLDVGDGHTLYWEQSGNPDGQPVVFLHGGPGAGSSPAHRRFFDPLHYRIIVFDQRGCARSTPYASIENNTTDHLIQDIETLRKHLDVDRWLVFGGSWGSTLALVYGIHHPQRCQGFVLRGIFLGTAAEHEWFIHGMATVFPEAHRDFRNFLPIEEQNELIDSYFKRLCDPRPEIHLPAAASWSRYETVCSTMLPGTLVRTPPPRRDIVPPDGASMLGISRLEAHYFKQSMFLEEGFILDNLENLSGLSAIIVQGRYDIVCPPISADKLARKWPQAESRMTVKMINDAGHSAMEPGTRRALVQATDHFRASLKAL
ncbi:MAG: prolyl aminopeptidase [Rhodospirillales bacterium]|nr:prolyl aminopeptidase [Rhodospirillales bacterium]